MEEEKNTWGGKREGAGAPEGNKNSSKSNRLFGETIKRIVHQSEGEIAGKVAWALINKAMEGDLGAIKEFGDRVDGKAVATQEHMTIDENGNPKSIGIAFVTTNSTVSE